MPKIVPKNKDKALIEVTIASVGRFHPQASAKVAKKTDVAGKTIETHHLIHS